MIGTLIETNERIIAALEMYDMAVSFKVRSRLFVPYKSAYALAARRDTGRNRKHPEGPCCDQDRRFRTHKVTGKATCRRRSRH